MERLVDCQTERETPEDLLAQLAEDDPVAELVYVGDGLWFLGAVRPTPFRREAGAAMLYRARAKMDRLAIRHATLVMQGFALITAVPDAGLADLVADFRRRDWEYRNTPTQSTFDLHDAALDTQEERLLAKVLDDMHAEKGLLRRTLRNAVTIDYGKAGRK